MQKNTKDLPNNKSTIKDLNDEKKAKTTKKATHNAKKVTPKKATSSSSTKKAASKTSTKRSSTKTSSTKVAKKNTTSKSKTASTSKKKTSSTRKPKKVEILEYYDLPYRYNQTVVKILAQTPNTLFVYWDISDIDRKKYVDEFGENFFESTVPVLIVHNRTMNYSFEIEINDFANSWYFDVKDAKCKYEIELGRRVKPSTNTISLPNNYMYVTSSNVIEAPNNHILFEKNQKTVFFRNVKNNTISSKNVSQFEFMKYVGRIYNINDIYKKIYKNEELQDLEKIPSSGRK